MPKLKTIYVCSSCGAQYPKWAGQCSECQAWNSIIEDVIEVTPAKVNPRKQSLIESGSDDHVVALNDIQCIAKSRISTSMEELDRVLGGGLVEGAVILIGGDPGIGKSTLLLQLSSLVGQVERPVFYVTGEESLEQVAQRGQRLGLSKQTAHCQLFAHTDVETILKTAKKLKPRVMIIDSIQTMMTAFLQSAPGTVSQVRESAALFVQFAKKTGCILFIVGHVTKQGSIAGPRVLEHMVDTVLYFEGDPNSRFRIVRAVKNRFGAVNELGMFAMTDKGLREVSNPSAIFLSGSERQAPGSVIMATWEGTRPILVEIQALADKSYVGNPRRVAIGLDQNRLSMLLAVLNRHVGMVTYDQDVFVNVVGGMRIVETASDLALLLAVISSLKDKPLPKDLLVFGEVGLSGEVRPVQSGQERLKEAFKHGFKKAIVPKANMPKQSFDGMEVMSVTNLQEAVYLINN